jgi:hypothetical protein
VGQGQPGFQHADSGWGADCRASAYGDRAVGVPPRGRFPWPWHCPAPRLPGRQPELRRGGAWRDSCQVGVPIRTPQLQHGIGGRGEGQCWPGLLPCRRRGGCCSQRGVGQGQLGARGGVAGERGAEGSGDQGRWDCQGSCSAR